MILEPHTPKAQEILIAVAQKQRQLLNDSFDFGLHMVRQAEKPKKKLFRRPEPTKRETLLLELENLRLQAEAICRCSGGQRWWQQSWDVIESILLAALESKPRDGGWRYESELRSFSAKDGLRYVVLFEEGASQIFSTNRIYQYDEVSPYSEQERKERMERYDQAVLDNYMSQKEEFSRNRKFVRSPLTEKLYQDFDEYYFSEGKIIDSIFRSNYETKMYADRVIQGVSVQAAARFNVKGFFALGAYRAEPSGQLLAFKSLDYLPLQVIPSDLTHILSNRHIPGFAILKLSEFLADSDSIRQIPFSLLSSIGGIAETQEDANLCSIQSAMMTILADKLVIS